MAMRLTGDRTTRSDFAPGELDAAPPHRYVDPTCCPSCGSNRTVTEETHAP